jgi:hypothetical protein
MGRKCLADLTIAFSVLASDFFSQKSKLEQYFSELETFSLDWMLIVQGEGERPEGLLDDNPEKITWSQDAGLSKSRNIALRQCETKFLICSDWDTRFANDLLVKLVSEVQAIKSEVPFIRLGLLRADDFELAHQKLLEQDKNQSIGLNEERSALALTNIASVQICWNVHFIRKHRLGFDELLGLGNKSILPSFGEEYLLALQCWGISGNYCQSPVLIACTREKSTGPMTSKIERAILALYVFLKLAKTHPLKSSLILFHRLKRFLKA